MLWWRLVYMILELRDQMYVFDVCITMIQNCLIYCVCLYNKSFIVCWLVRMIDSRVRMAESGFVVIGKTGRG